MAPIKVKKLFTALVLVSVTHLAMGSFTGTSEKKSRNLYSLKNFNRYFSKNTLSFSLRSGYQLKGSQLLNQKQELNGDITFNSMMRYEKGNTTYLYPYTHKVNVAKFKTPTSPSVR